MDAVAFDLVRIDVRSEGHQGCDLGDGDIGVNIIAHGLQDVGDQGKLPVLLDLLKQSDHHLPLACGPHIIQSASRFSHAQVSKHSLAIQMLLPFGDKAAIQTV